MGMLSFLFVSIYLFLSSIFYISSAFAYECYADIPAPKGSLCYDKDPGTYPDSVKAPAPRTSPPKSHSKKSRQPIAKKKGGGIKQSSGSQSSSAKNHNVSPESSTDEDDQEEYLGSTVCIPGSEYCGQCRLQGPPCPIGYHCQNDSCIADSKEDESEAQTNACMSQYESLMQQCQKQIDDTASTCDEKNDSDISNAMNGASEITLAMGKDVASNVQKSCSDMADLMQGANIALAGYRLSCGNSISTCNDVCSQVTAFAVANNSCLTVPIPAEDDTDLTTRGKNAVRECNSFKSKVNQANTAIDNFTKILNNASNCKIEHAANVALSKLPQFCQSQPNYPGCNPQAPVDCNNPAMAQNKVCVCSKNPMDQGCFVAQKGGGNNGLGLGGMIDPKSRLGNNADPGFGGDRPDLPPIDVRDPNKSAGSPISGHQGGNGGVGGGDTGGGGPAQTGSGSGSSDAQANNSGFYGPGNGSFNGNNGGYADGSGRGRNTAGTGNPAIRRAGSPDLRKFLPGGQYDPRRGLSGMTGPDGITGPHTDIWRKVQNRYQVTSPTLLP